MYMYIYNTNTPHTLHVFVEDLIRIYKTFGKSYYEENVNYHVIFLYNKICTTIALK